MNSRVYLTKGNRAGCVGVVYVLSISFKYYNSYFGFCNTKYKNSINYFLNTFELSYMKKVNVVSSYFVTREQWKNKKKRREIKFLRAIGHRQMPSEISFNIGETQLKKCCQITLYCSSTTLR